MASVLRNLVEIVGIADQFPTAPTNFTQIAVAETLKLPDAKPDIEQITKVTIDTVITSTNVVATPIGTAVGGTILTGAKLIIEGKLRQKVEYVANEPTQSVHAAEFEMPFSTFVVIPLPVLPITPQLALKYPVEAFIEDVYINQIDARTIFKNVTVFLNVTILP